MPERVQSALPVTRPPESTEQAALSILPAVKAYCSKCTSILKRPKHTVRLAWKDLRER